MQQAPQNREAAVKAESERQFAEAASLWGRVAEATDDVEAFVAAARNYLRCPHLADQAKAGPLARKAIALDPHHVRANKVLLDFFEHTGMHRSAERQRGLLEDLD